MAAMAAHTLSITAIAIALSIAVSGMEGGDMEDIVAGSDGARRLRGEMEDTDAVEIQKLQKQIHEEQVRAEIAGYASVAAISNATKEAALRRTADAALAKAQPDLDAAHASLAQAQREVEDLKAQLAVAQQEQREASNSVKANSQRAETASAQIRDAQAAEAKAKVRASAAETKESQVQKALQAAQDATKAADAKAADLQAATEAALRRSRLPPQKSLSDLALFSFLYTCSYQPLLAFSLGVAGLYSIVDGPRFFQGLFISVFALAVGACVCAESSAFSGDLGFLGNVVAGTEAALVTAFACYFGLNGFQIVAGAFLGLSLAYGLSGYCIVDSPENKLFEVGWYCAAALIGAIAMFFGDRNAHAVVGPLVGGLLFASLQLYLAAFFAVAAHTPASSAKFFDFIEALLTGRGAMAVFGEQGMVVRIVGAVIWLVLFALGISQHFCGWPRFGKRVSLDDDNDDYRRRSKKSRSDRTEPLLPPPREDRSRRYDEDPPLPSARSEGSKKSSLSKPSPRPQNMTAFVMSGRDRKEQFNMYGEVG